MFVVSSYSRLHRVCSQTLLTWRKWSTQTKRVSAFIVAFHSLTQIITQGFSLTGSFNEIWALFITSLHHSGFNQLLCSRLLLWLLELSPLDPVFEYFLDRWSCGAYYVMARVGGWGMWCSLVCVCTQLNGQQTKSCLSKELPTVSGVPSGVPSVRGHRPRCPLTEEKKMYI